MSLRLRYDTLDAVPEALRSHYAPDPQGGVVFQADDLPDLLAAPTAEITQLKDALGQAHEARFAAVVEAACGKALVRDSSRADVLRAAREAFQDKDAAALTPSALAQWLEDQRRVSPTQWWDLPSGAGSPPARVGAGGFNPFANETFNLTEQGRLLRSHPDLARALRDQARAGGSRF